MKPYAGCYETAHHGHRQSGEIGETAKLDSLKLTENGDKAAPGVEFTKPLEVTEPTVKVVTEGGGDAHAAVLSRVGLSERSQSRATMRRRVDSKTLIGIQVIHRPHARHPSRRRTLAPEGPR